MKTHFSLQPVGDNVAENLKNKVDSVQFFKLPLDNDFQKGVFFHLLTDYIFYNFYFDRDFLGTQTHNEFSGDLYSSYNLTNDWLERTYRTDRIKTDFAELMAQNIKNLQSARPEILSAIPPALSGVNFLSDTDKLSRFIDFVSSFDLQRLKNSRDFGSVNW
jgi:hypothetical protein